MHALITSDLSAMPPQQPKTVTYTVGGAGRTFRTDARDVTPEQYPNIDPDLAILVQWCMARNPVDRPTIECLIIELQRVTDNATPQRYQSYPNKGRYESNSKIRWLVQRLILDA
jgi:hypothetical protein